MSQTHPRTGNDAQAKCVRCQAHLSTYRSKRETYCAPCWRTITTHSFQVSAEPIKPGETQRTAFILRWRGLEWETIKQRINAPSIGSAQRSAQEYARKNQLRLP